MPLIASALLRYWKPLALVALLACALAYCALLIHQRDSALAQVVQLTAEAAALRVSNQALGASIQVQNAAIAKLKGDADAAAQMMNSRMAAASIAGIAAAARGADQARALIAAPIESGSGCEGAIQWGNARAAELSSW
jgi:cell division protein FtsB